MSLALALFALTLPVSIAGINIAAALLSVLVLTRWKNLKLRQAFRNPGVYALVAYCLASLVSALLGVDPRHSLAAWNKDFHKLWILTLALLATSDEPAPPAVAAALGAGFALVGLIGIGQTLSQAATAHVWLRAHAFVHPVTYGEQLVFGLLGVACFAVSPEQRPKDGQLLWALGGILAVALACNQTRAALVALFVGIAALCAVEPRLRRAGLWALLGCVGVAVLWEALLPAGGRTFVAAFAAKPNSQQTRYVLWHVAWQAFRDRPWTGVGPSNYGVVFPHYFTGVLEGQRVWGSAHNLYLHQLAERGILGETVLMLAFGIFLWRAGTLAVRRRNAWTLWAFSGWIAFLVMNVTETAFQTEQMATLVLFLWACSETSAAGHPDVE